MSSDNRLPDEYDQTILALSAGELLSERYRLIKEIGRGGMGIVWLAEDSTLEDRAVAIKLLPSVLSMNQRAIGRLKREATTCLDLTHSHIVRLLTFEQDTNHGNVAYLVMQYVDGSTLDDLLANHPDGLPVERVLKWAAQIAGALDHAHAKNVLHRDIKPTNIMIDRDDNAYLMDFGIAREAKDTMTKVTGRESSGTLPYMSPQHVDGHNHKSNDIYSFAATLYEALNGEPPFTTGDLYQQIKHVPVSPIKGQGEAINDALLAALGKQPEGRPATAGDLVNGIDGNAFKRVGGNGAKPSTGKKPKKQTGSTSKFAGIAATILAITAISIGGWWGYQQGWFGGSGSSGNQTQRPATPTGLEQPGNQDLAKPESEIASKTKSIDSDPIETAEVEPLVPEVTKAEVIPVRSAASTIRDEAGQLAKGQRFASRIREMETSWLSAEEFYNQNLYAEALEYYKQIQAACKQLLDDDLKRATASSARDRWDEAIGSLPEPLYSEVTTEVSGLRKTCDNALNSYEAGQFDDTAVVWEQSLPVLKGLLSQHDTKLQEAERAKQTWEARKSKSDKPTKWYDEGQDVRTNRAKAEQEARRATGDVSAGRFDEAVQTFGQAASAWGEAIQSHEAALSELLRIAQSTSPRKEDRKAAMETYLEYHSGNASTERLQTKILALFVPNHGDQKKITLAGGKSMTFIYIDAPNINGGVFQMGSPSNEKDRDDNEGPQHRVTISKGFWLGETEVTQAQWSALMKMKPWSGQDYTKEGGANAASYISWDDASSFCDKLSGSQAGTFRLPSEAEWEFACRAGRGSSTRFSFGNNDSDLGAYAWFGGNPNSKGENYAHAVRKKKPNAWGLYDLHGNVYEWCADWYDEDYYQSSPDRDPEGPNSGTSRVLRGGSWSCSPRLVRSALRYAFPTVYSTNYSGFRVAMDLN